METEQGTQSNPPVPLYWTKSADSIGEACKPTCIVAYVRGMVYRNLPRKAKKFILRGPQIDPSLTRSGHTSI